MESLWCESQPLVEGCVEQETGLGLKRGIWVPAIGGKGLPGRIPHDFRRTAVRNLVRAGIPERVAMTMTGHKTRSVFERYNIVSQGDLLDAARRLDSASGVEAANQERKLAGTNAGTMLRSAGR
jgi:hypothetical protein